MKIATLTIDRGDRPKMIAQCKRMIERQTRKPDLEIYVIEPSILRAVDIVPRFRSGWLHAKESGIDVIVVMESDDWYGKDYIKEIITLLDVYDADAIGFHESLYYNICNQTYQTHTHYGRASLYTTVFKTSCLNDFKWPKDDYKFLDIPLWKHLKEQNLRDLVDVTKNSWAIGIKHNEGVRAGIGHTATMKHKDTEFKYLESVIGDDVFFYKNFCNG